MTRDSKLLSFLAIRFIQANRPGSEDDRLARIDSSGGWKAFVDRADHYQNRGYMFFQS